MGSHTARLIGTIGKINCGFRRQALSFGVIYLLRFVKNLWVTLPEVDGNLGIVRYEVSQQSEGHTSRGGSAIMGSQHVESVINHGVTTREVRRES